MTVHTYPQIRTLLVTMVVVLTAFIIDQNLKSTPFQYDFGSVSRRWVNQAYMLLTDKLLRGTQPTLVCCRKC